jgi:hypothetical protein
MGYRGCTGSPAAGQSPAGSPWLSNRNIDTGTATTHTRDWRPIRYPELEPNHVTQAVHLPCCCTGDASRLRKRPGPRRRVRARRLTALEADVAATKHALLAQQAENQKLAAELNALAASAAPGAARAKTAKAELPSPFDDLLPPAR